MYQFALLTSKRVLGGRQPGIGGQNDRSCCLVLCHHKTHGVESEGKGIAGVHGDGISASAIGADIAAEVVRGEI